MMSHVVAGVVVVVVALAAESRAESPAPTAVAYVNASELRVRAAPSTSAKVVVKLPVNAPLKVLKEASSTDAPAMAWLHVKIGDGREGFVAKDMVSTAKLDVTTAHQNAKNAKDAAQKVMWLERAAALSPHKSTLLELASALRARKATGDVERATLLEKRVSWPEDLFVVVESAPKRVSIEPGISVSDADARSFAERGDGSGRAATSDELKQYGYVVGERWWLLPARGNAVEAKLTGATLRILNECGGENGVWVHLEPTTPLTERAVAATRRKEPPPSWKSALPSVDLVKAEQAVRALTSKKAPKDAKVGVVSDQDGVVTARVFWMPPEEPEKDWYEQQHRVINVRIDAKGKASIVSEERGDHMDAGLPVARRDVDGDGTLELFLDDGCGMIVIDDQTSSAWSGAGTVTRTQTSNRCCGC